MPMKKITLILALSGVMALCACRSGDGERPIARVGRSTLTLQEVRRMAPASAANPWSAKQAATLVQQWVESELLYQEALREGLDKEAAVQEAIERQAKACVVTFFLAQKLTDHAAVSDAEIESYYQECAGEFSLPEETYHLRVILVATLPEANAVRQMIVSGTPFAEVAKRRSMDGSRGDGGDWGWVTLSRLSPLLARAIPSLRTGEVSRPIKSEVGYNLLWIESSLRKGSTMPLEQVRDEIVQRIAASKREKKYQQLIQWLSREIAIQTDLEALQSLSEKEAQ